ncbi:MAG: ABC transporter ATP-binding protein [Candidatus Omnitrophota bacterium]
MNKLIEVISLSKVYNSGGAATTALCDINMAVFDGEYLAIIGPSGAGKSTLLHIIGGLDFMSKGKVLFDGKDLFRRGEINLYLWRNRTIGFVFQFYHLIEELSVLENVALPSFLTKARRKTSLKQAQKLLEYLGIESKKGQRPSQLSGGEKQKVAIARALINDARIIFCDEPTGNLDKDSQNVVMELLLSLNREKKKTLIIVTHNLELVKDADRIVNIKAGQIVN